MKETHRALFKTKECETIVTLSAIFSFRNGLIIAKMPLKILGSLIMLTALILIGNPSCELEESCVQGTLLAMSHIHMITSHDAARPHLEDAHHLFGEERAWV